MLRFGRTASLFRWSRVQDRAVQTRDMDRLVRAVAGRVLARLPRGSGLEMADLIQAGNIGLLQAKRTFNPESGVSLAGYAKFRIRGEMLDTVRRCAGPMPVLFHAARRRRG